MLEIKIDMIVVVLIFLKHNGLFWQVISSSNLWWFDSTFDNFHNSWQEEIHNKIMLKAYFHSSVKNMLLYENIC